MMELSTLAILILGCSFSLFAILVDSQNNVNVPAQPSLSTPPPAPPSPSPPPPVFFQRSSPQTPSPPPPPPSTLPLPPPPPLNPQSLHPNSPPGSKKNTTLSSQSNHNVHNDPISRDKHGLKKVQRDHINMGKMIGLLFIGIAGFLQICVAALLIFKRQQLVKIKDRYEIPS